MRAAAKRFMLMFLSLEKESKNSSHSSIMSRSVLGFLPIWDSMWYFMELKIRTSAFWYVWYWSRYWQPGFLEKKANSFPQIASYFIFLTSGRPFGLMSDGMTGPQ